MASRTLPYVLIGQENGAADYHYAARRTNQPVQRGRIETPATLCSPSSKLRLLFSPERGREGLREEGLAKQTCALAIKTRPTRPFNGS
jgi:hypothetical protein